MIIALSTLLPGFYTLVPLPAAAAQPLHVQGHARVLDGDTLVVSRTLLATCLHLVPGSKGSGCLHAGGRGEGAAVWGGRT